MWWMPLIMAAGGAVKGISDKKQETRDRIASSEATRYSPWTGMQGQPVQKADVAGSTLQGFSAGMGLGQNMDSADQANAFQKQQLALQQQQADSQAAKDQAMIKYYNNAAYQGEIGNPKKTNKGANPQASDYGVNSSYMA